MASRFASRQPRLAVLSLLAALLPAAAACSQTIVAGDTFILDGETVRVAGIDAPDPRRPRCEEEYTLGLEAKARLRAMLVPGSVRIERVRHEHDGSTVARTFAEGRDVAARMLAEGLALEDRAGREAELERVRRWCGRAAGLDDTFAPVPIPKPRPEGF